MTTGSCRLNNCLLGEILTEQREISLGIVSQNPWRGADPLGPNCSLTIELSMPRQCARHAGRGVCFQTLWPCNAKRKTERNVPF
jgi:hypothetical protein